MNSGSNVEHPIEKSERSSENIHNSNSLARPSHKGHHHAHHSHKKLSSKSVETIVPLDWNTPSSEIQTTSASVDKDNSNSRNTVGLPRRVSQIIFAFQSLDSIYLCPVPDLPPSSIRLNSHRKYEVLDYNGTRLFYAAEHESCLIRVCCSESRSFEMEVYDLEGRSFLNISRNLSCSLCLCGTDMCCNCCNDTVVTGGNTYYGKVRILPSSSKPIYVIEDGDGLLVFSILGPKWGYWLICRLCYIVEFHICLPDSNVSLGKIQRGYDGLNEGNIPNPNTVSVIFPPACTPEIKACLVAAAFMIDVTYFDHRGRTASRFIRRFVLTILILSLLGVIFYLMFFRNKRKR